MCKRKEVVKPVGLKTLTICYVFPSGQKYQKYKNILLAPFFKKRAFILKQISVLKLKTDKNSSLYQLEISSLQYSTWLKFFPLNLLNILTDKVKSQVTTELWSKHLNSA